MSGVLDEIAEEETWQVERPQLWLALSILATCGAVAVLLAAGVALSGATLGSELRAPGCDLSPLTALICVVLASALLILARSCMARREPGVRWQLAWREPLLPAAGSILVLTVTLPGVFGCESAAARARWPLIGDAVVASPGLMVSAAACAALGAAIGMVWQVGAARAVDASRGEPSIVDQAIAEAEARELDQAAQRFRGVDFE